MAGGALDADVAEALKQLKRGFSDTGGPGGAGHASKPRPPPPPWESQKMARTMPPNMPKQGGCGAAAQFGRPQMPMLARPAGGPLGNISAALRGPGAVFQDFGGMPSPNPPGLVTPKVAPAPLPALAKATPAAPQPGKGQTSATVDVPSGTIAASTKDALKALSGAECHVDEASNKVTIIGQAAEVEKCKRAVEGLADGSMSTSIIFQLAGLPAPQPKAASSPARPPLPAGSLASSPSGSSPAPAGAIPSSFPSAPAAGLGSALAAQATRGLTAGGGLCGGSGGLGAGGGLGASTGGLGASGGLNAGAGGLGGGGLGASGLGAGGGLGAAGGGLGGGLGGLGAAGLGLPGVAGGLMGSAQALPGLSFPAVAPKITEGAALPMQDKLNEYYAQWWSQYGRQAQLSATTAAEPEQEDAPEEQSSAPAAFDKEALLRLAAAAQQSEPEPKEEPAPAPRAAQPPARAPEPVPRERGLPGLPDTEMDLGDAAPPLPAARPRSPEPAGQPPAPRPAAPQSAAAPPPAAAPQRQGFSAAPAVAAPPLPKATPFSVQAPLAPAAKAVSGFAGFSLQSAAPQQQKDNDSVQKMLQQLQNNMQQTKQAMSVQGLAQPAPQAPAPASAAPQSALQASAPSVPQMEQPRSSNADWEAYLQRVSRARAPEEIEEVGRDILTKFPTLPPEQLADLLQHTGTMVGLYHGDFLGEISRLLALRLKGLTSTQFALLLSAFLQWPGDTRERFSEFSKEFFHAAMLEMPSRLMELAAHELNCALAALASLGAVEHKFFVLVGRSALARHRTFPPGQLAAFLTILSEMRLVHNDLFVASAQTIVTRSRELRPVEMLRVLRAFAKCGVQSDALCQAMGEEVATRFKDRGANAGFKVEDLCEISWLFCVMQSYHEPVFRLMFHQLGQHPKVSADALCMLYESHLVLDTEFKANYTKYRLSDDHLSKLRDHYTKNRLDSRRCTDKCRNDVVAVLKSLVDGTVQVNHRTSLGLLVDIAALRKKTSGDGYVHVEVDSALTAVRQLEQEETASPTPAGADGSVALRRRILQKHGLKVVTVREHEWLALEGEKEKRRHLRSLLATVTDVAD